MKTRIRFIATANTREMAETMAEGCKKANGCVHTIIHPLTNGAFQIRSFWRYSQTIARQDGAVVVEV